MGSVTDTKATVLVVGTGAVGALAAYVLETGGGAIVTAVLRSNYAAVKQDGFTIESPPQWYGHVSGWRPTHILNQVPDPVRDHLPPFDYVVVASKNLSDIPPSVVELVAPAITAGHTAIVLLQNGLNIERPLVAAFPANPVLSGITLVGALQPAPGRIQHAHEDVVSFGAFASGPGVRPADADAAARRLAAMYAACPGSRCAYVHAPDVPLLRWRKLLYNASFNSVATVLHMDTTRMRASEFVIDELVRPAMREIAAAAMAAAGVRLTEDMMDNLIHGDRWESFFKPSMCQDIEKGNFIEFETIVGEPLREGEKHGVPMPTLKTLYAQLKALQWQTKESKGLVQVPREPNASLKYGKQLSYI